MMSLNANRRLFLKRIATGGVGLFFYGSVSNLLANQVNQGLHTLTNADDSVNFPFFDYIKQFNIGEFIPKDQGGKFVQMELLGTEEDEIIVKKITEGLLGEVYGNPIKWGGLEKIELEKSVWLNRFYYLPSFARLYFLNKDEKALKFMMQFIQQWITENPRLVNKKDSKYNWYDMQVAWRSIYLSWCYFLCQKGLNDADKELIFNTLEEHAIVLLSGFGEQRLNEFNHQVHGALAMLYLGVLFPSLTQAEQLKTSAIRILNHHLKHAFYSDGGNIEQMFGYYPFETHIFRDAYLLCQHNQVNIPDELLPMLQKMAVYLSLVAQPDDTMPPVNDSYPMEVKTTLSTLQDIPDIQVVQPKKSHYFSETQIGVMHVGTSPKYWYLLANPAKRIGSHAHAGRLSFVLWFNQQPVLVDSGCCNYDNPQLIKWYRTSKAHNTVLIDGKSDEATSSKRLWVSKRITDNRITNWIENDKFSWCRMESPASEAVNAGVLWQRDLVIVKNKYLIIHDRFQSSDEHRFQSLFHFPPVQVTKENNNVLRFQGKEEMLFVPANKKLIDQVILQDGLVSVKGKGEKAPTAKYSFSGSGTTHFVLVCKPISNEDPKMIIKQKDTQHGTALMINNANNEKTVVLIRNPESTEISAMGYKTTQLMEVF